MAFQITWSFLFSAALLWSCHSGTKTIYVHPAGNPDAPGTKENPLSSPQGALDKVSDLRQNFRGPLTILLAPGTYRLTEPLVISPALGPLTLQGIQAAEVKIKGSIVLDCTWQRYKDQIWVAKVANPPVIFDQLYVSGQCQTLARYPNYDPAGGDWQGHAGDAVAPARPQRWKNPTGGYVHAMHAGRWGDFHYLITGKDADGALSLTGGHQNNRPAPWHAESRMVENIFEELDTTGEWFYSAQEQALYYWPPDSMNLPVATVEVSALKHLVEFKGTAQNPLTDITIEGIHFQHTRRTFMEPYHRLLRSDWSIYRGGAMLLDGTAQCTIRHCVFSDLGGNAIFLNGYNRQVTISGNHIYTCGASGICLVGDSTAVRSPSFQYQEFVEISVMDTISGPANDLYPAHCFIINNLIHHIGRIEKQVAGVQLSMANAVQVMHNTIYDVPRAGINIGDGTWGGHLIAFNDVFNTVLETGDHGAFNSWGRDRFWHLRWETIDSLTKANPNMPYWDAQQTTIIRNNRFRCDHGWDIDLDDGSSNYHIYDNLCLNGGIKLREGFYRVVRNNIMINNGFHPHVWFAHSEDVFTQNIVMTKHFPILLRGWGRQTDHNFFPDSSTWFLARNNGTDQNSLYGNPQFINPDKGDYRVQPTSPALHMGFVNFSMDSFGVQIAELKRLAKQPDIPELIVPGFYTYAKKTVIWLGGTIKAIESGEEQSALGLFTPQGILIEKIPEGSELQRHGFLPRDVILKVDGQPIQSMGALLSAYQENVWKGKITMTIQRRQAIMDVVLKT